MQKTEEAPFKKFVLIDAIKSTADIVQKTSINAKDGIRLDTPRSIMLFLEHTLTDKNGKQRRTRFKLGSNTIFKDIQIKDESIPANEKFTDEERGMLRVVNGALVTNHPLVLEYIHEDWNPQRVEFTGQRTDGSSAIIMELDEDKIAREENEYLFALADAMVAIKKMKEPELRSLLARFFGASYVTPPTFKKHDLQNEAIKALQDNDDNIKIVLEGQVTIDDEVVILLNKAFHYEIVSFESKKDWVQVKRGEVWHDAKFVVGDTYEERENLFKQFLSLPAGQLLREDIERLVAEHEKADETEEVEPGENKQDETTIPATENPPAENKDSNANPADEKKNNSKPNSRNTKT